MASEVKTVADNPGLLTKAMRPGWSGHRLAAENIRRRLRAKFPGVKFHVTSNSYSGGNSVDIRWTDGPTSKQVRDARGAHEQGTFDGMTDCYEYAKNPFGDVYGAAKYVFEQREWTDAGLAEAFRRRFGDAGLLVDGETLVTPANAAEVQRGNDYNASQWVTRTWGECDLSAA